MQDCRQNQYYDSTKRSWMTKIPIQDRIGKDFCKYPTSTKFYLLPEKKITSVCVNCKFLILISLYSIKLSSMLLIINLIINSIKLSRMLLIINLINSIQLKLSDLTPHKSVSQIRCSNLQKIEEMSPPFLSLSHHSYQILDYLLFLIPFICFSFQTLLFDQHVSSTPKKVCLILIPPPFSSPHIAFNQPLPELYPPFLKA